jgi:ribonuclease HII
MALGWDLETEARQQGHASICGVDEAGRGPWAGPVVAAAVILPEGFGHSDLNDSKRVPPSLRAKVAAALQADSAVVWAIGIADVKEIDSLNILQATFLAMKRAVAGLQEKPHCALIDGRDCPDLGCRGRAVIGGDGLSPSIAAASILAKEHRDGLMREWAHQYPEYAFETHKGYGTALHQEKLKHHGPCPIHRRSFAPIRALLPGGV